jgi:terminase small subunit / prophage DNA-packing protein
LSNTLLTRRQLADLHGVVPGRITKWERDGLPVAERGTKGRPSQFDPQAVQQWLDARESTAQTPDHLDLAQERARLARLQADRVALDIAVKEGQLVPASEVEAAWASLVLSARERLLALPSIALQRGVVDAAGEDQLIQLVRESLDELTGRQDPA